MILVLLIFIFVCVFYGNLVLNNLNDEFINVVYLKFVRLSFYVFRWYNGFYVVNGMFFDFIYILVEKFFWLRIDFGVRY